MAEAREALRETSDDMVRDLDVLTALEDEKRATDPSDPRLVELSERIERVAGRVLAASTRQGRLARLTVGEAATESELPGAAGSLAPGEPGTAIEDMPRSIASSLTDWREAERHLAAAEAGSAEEIEARARAARARADYAQAYDTARRQSGGELS